LGGNKVSVENNLFYAEAYRGRTQ